MMCEIDSLPEEQQLHNILTILYGNNVNIMSRNSHMIEYDKNMLAVYINEEGEFSTCCACNYNFVAYASSAITKIKVKDAISAAKSGQFSHLMLTNLYQLMNICSCLYSYSDSQIKLDQIYQSINEVPESIRCLLENKEQYLGYDIKIPGYGRGVLSFI